MKPERKIDHLVKEYCLLYKTPDLQSLILGGKAQGERGFTYSVLKFAFCSLFSPLDSLTLVTETHHLGQYFLNFNVQMSHLCSYDRPGVKACLCNKLPDSTRFKSRISRV